MKKIILCFVIFFSLAATSLFAQQTPGVEQMQQMQRQYLKDSVHLSDAMVDSVMAVRMQYQPQMRQIFMDQSLGDADKQAKVQTIRTEMETRFKMLGLTDDQIKMIREHDQRMREQMRNRMNNPNGSSGSNQ
jgi:hypothetical protein